MVGDPSRNHRNSDKISDVNSRHLGTPTRLLDWTEVLSVALYFAIKNAYPGSIPCIWLLNPYRLNVHSWEVEDLVAPEYLPQGDYDFADYLVDFSDDAGFDWDEPVALYPEQRNSRLHAQRGYFTISGEDTRPLNQIRPSVFRKVILPIDAVPEARQFLAMSGIDEHLLFPDLDGLSRYLQAKYRLLG
jgi:hypothetical protein